MSKLSEAMDYLRHATDDEGSPVLQREYDALRADKRRLDWLADPANEWGTVQLPKDCVLANVHSLRDAIDMAMRVHAPSNA